MKNIIIILTAVFMFISACKMKKKIDIDIPDEEKHIVVNGIIDKENPIKIRISKSKGILENDIIEYIETADVKLFKNNVFIENMQHTDSGFYKSIIKPEESAEYKINVSYKDMKSVTGTTLLKTPVEIIKVDTSMSKDYLYDEEGESDENIKGYAIACKVKIIDNADNEDFYFIVTEQITPQYNQDYPYEFVGYLKENRTFYSSDPVLKDQNQNFTLEQMTGTVFSDKMFNGSQYILNLNSSAYIKENGNEETYFIVKLLTVSKDLYRYILSHNINNQTHGDPFSQPVQVFSNIENGLGIFTGYTVDADTLVLNDF